MRENDGAAEEPGSNWPLAQQILADLQDFRSQNGDIGRPETSEPTFESLKQQGNGFWSSNGLKGWLDYHLGNLHDEGTDLSADLSLRPGAITFGLQQTVA